MSDNCRIVSDKEKIIITLSNGVMVIKLFSLSRMLRQKAIVFIADEWQLQNRQWQRKKYYNIVKRCHGYKAFFFVTIAAAKSYSVHPWWVTIAEFSVTKKKYYNIVKGWHGYKAFLFVTNAAAKSYSVHRWWVTIAELSVTNKKVL